MEKHRKSEKLKLKRERRMWEENQVYSKLGFKAAPVVAVTTLRVGQSDGALAAGVKGKDTPKLLEPFPAESLPHKPHRQA